MEVGLWEISFDKNKHGIRSWHTARYWVCQDLWELLLWETYRERSRRKHRQQHHKMSNMPYYMSRAVTDKNRKWLLADTFLFLSVTIGRKPAARRAKRIARHGGVKGRKRSSETRGTAAKGRATGRAGRVERHGGEKG